MRLVICNEEGGMMQVGVDGEFYSGLDGSSLADDVHAVQWFGDHGWVEKKDPISGRMTANEEISAIADFQFAVDAWNTAYQAEQDALLAESEQTQEN